MRISLRWSAWLALLLMLGTAAAETSHHHSLKAESASCSICVAAHSTAPAPISNHSRPVFATVGLLQEEAIIAQAWLQVFDLDIRGPPTA
jgi:hypothetical protein